MQSPLCAGLLRFLNARPAESLDIDALMSTFGFMRLNVDNCLSELVEFGVVRRLPGSPSTYIARRPQHRATERLLNTFLERRAAIRRNRNALSWRTPSEALHSMRVPATRLSLSISAGAAVFPHDGDTYEALLATANGRMYGDKRARKTAAARRLADAADVTAVDLA